MTQLRLFGDVSPKEEATSVRKAKKHSAGEWEITDHACRHCMGRILRRAKSGGGFVVCCSECGASVDGDCTSLCWCGVEVRGYGAVFECIRNENISQESPQQVLVREKHMTKSREKEPVRRSSPVRLEGY